MNRNRHPARGDQIAALLAVMTPDENYSADDLATRLGGTIFDTRILIHAAEDAGAIWQHRAACKGPPLWVRRERRREPSMAAGKQIQGYEREWRTFRDLCMLTRTG
ncbi:hypothetical protein G3A43_40980 [Paraburkholderia aspalathi]|uniref:hypothetical protein n=1 Tax=Paraburkholderia nemoris TaxID=2793076 RepID=UPI00190AF9F3|nr:MULTISPECIES: hypothetical protein [Paraburkholderia]MBK3786575.1 hypothetical protein [Paraburkholderia aspalathi]